jgi:hypothetical protein
MVRKCSCGKPITKAFFKKCFSCNTVKKDDDLSSDDIKLLSESSDSDDDYHYFKDGIRVPKSLKEMVDYPSDVESDPERKPNITHEIAYKKKPIPKTVKNCVWLNYFEKCVGVCQCCHREKISFNNFACGHIIAERHGGKTTLDNLRPICTLCNLSMGTQNMDEFIKEYNLNYFLPIDNEKRKTNIRIFKSGNCKAEGE